MEDFLNQISEEFIQERVKGLKEMIQAEKNAIFIKVYSYKKELFNSLNLKIIKKSSSQSFENEEQMNNICILSRKSEEKLENGNIQSHQMNENEISLKKFDQKQVQNCFSLFEKACSNILNTYFPLLMDDEFLSLQSENQIQEKISYLRSIVEKTASNLLKKLTKPDQFQKELKKDDLMKENAVDIGESSVEISCQNRHKKQKIKKQRGVKGSSERKKGKNTKIPNQSTYVMQKWLLQNFQDPYPTLEQKKEMALKSGLTFYQVNNWFINARERVIKKYLKKDNVSNQQTNKNRKSSHEEEYTQEKKSRKFSKRQNNSKSQISEGSVRISNLSEQKEELMGEC